MAILINKRNGNIDSIYIHGDELKPLLGLIQILWNESSLLHSTTCYLKGVEALHTIMKEFV